MPSSWMDGALFVVAMHVLIFRRERNSSEQGKTMCYATSRNRFATLGLVSFLVHAVLASAYLHHHVKPNHRQQKRAFLSIPLAVTIFPSFDSSANESNSSNSSREGLLQSPRWTGPLARLAAALGHVQNAASIAQVRVVSCDACHLDLEAVVCEQEQCVSLHIPVDLVHPCYSQELSDQEYEHCLLDNLEQLNNLQQQHPTPVPRQSTDSPTSVARTRVTTSGPDQQEPIQLPDWWVFSESFALAKECDKLRELLNRDDFREDLVHLWTRNSPQQEQQTSIIMDTSTISVARIGLAGMVLLQQLHGSGAVTSDETNTNQFLALRFQGLTPVSNSNDLREAVLTLMEQE